MIRSVALVGTAAINLAETTEALMPAVVKAGRFATVPGDDKESIPLPDASVAAAPASATQVTAAGSPTS